LVSSLTLAISIDELVYVKANNTEAGLNDRDLIDLFKKVQRISTKKQGNINSTINKFKKAATIAWLPFLLNTLNIFYYLALFL
jgi:hypothetical protein